MVVIDEILRLDGGSTLRSGLLGPRLCGGDVFTGSEKPLSWKHNIFTTVKGRKLALYNLQFKLNVCR